MARLDSFLRVVIDQRGSDLHLHAGKPPLVRLDGELVPLPFRALYSSDARRLIDEILSDAQRDRFARDRQLDFIHAVEGLGRFRANIFQQNDGASAVFRVIPAHPPTLVELGMPPVVRTFTRLQNGLVLICGATGSGKSTTLAALVNEINANSARHVITLEDPIEVVHPPLRSVVNQREVGRDVESFATGLRSALRESPDVLMVGELRDAETVGLALQAAETGVLVLGTLHTSGAVKAVDRVVDAVPEAGREQARAALSVLLRGVVTQHLCRRANGEGRVAALETLVQDHAVSNMIRSNKVHLLEAHLQSASNDRSGNESMDHCLYRYVRDGLVTREEALRSARVPERLLERIKDLVDDD
jgi:twitching motility protein PilT